MGDKALRGNKLTRIKRGWGGAAILGKKGVEWLWKNRKKVREELNSPEGKKKTKEMFDNFNKKLQEAKDKIGKK